MAPCANCGKDFPSEYINCPFCGYTRAMAAWRQNAPTPAPDAGDSLDRVDREVERNVGRLKWTLPTIAFATILAWVPVIGEVLAGLLGLIGFVGLLLAWHGLGDSALKRAQRYGRTFWALLFVFVVSFLILVSYLAGLGSQLATQVEGGASPASAVVGTLQGILVILVVVSLMNFAAQSYMALSLRSLAQDLSETRLRLAGVLYLVALPVAFAALVLVWADVSSPQFLAAVRFAINGQASLTTSSILFTGSYSTLAGIAVVLGVGLYFSAAFFSFIGARRFLARLGEPGQAQRNPTRVSVETDHSSTRSRGVSLFTFQAPSSLTFPAVPAGRPTGVTALAILQFAGGVASAGLSLFFWVVTFTGYDIAFVLAFLFLLVGIIGIGSGWGLWSGEKWAWSLSVALVVMGLLADVGGIILGNLVYVAGLAVGVVVLGYLFRPHVKEYFT